MSNVRNQQKGSWSVRRRIIVSTLIFCAYVVIYIMHNGTDNKLNETIVTCAFLLSGSVIGSYVFGAIWEDNKKVFNNLAINESTEEDNPNTSK